jgi:hypothetical protein
MNLWVFAAAPKSYSYFCFISKYACESPSSIKNRIIEWVIAQSIISI